MNKRERNPRLQARGEPTAARIHTLADVIKKYIENQKCN